MRRLLVAAIAAGSAVTLGLVPDSAVAAFPGGNGRIAYSICPDLPVGPSCGGTPKLMTIAAGGGVPRRVGDGVQARWSADGRWLVSVASWVSKRLLITRADGRQRRRIALRGIGEYAEGPVYPTWFPRGREVYFLAVGAGWFRAAIGDQSLARARRVSRRSGGWLSPSGHRVVSARFAANGPGAVISVAVLDGTRRRDILHVDAMPERIDWSPDGHRLVFDGAGLHTVNVDGRGYQLIPGTDSAWKHPAWSPDGKRIVATRLTCPCTEASRPNELLTVNADGSGQHVIVNDAHGVSWPDWQPAIPPSAPR